MKRIGGLAAAVVVAIFLVLGAAAQEATPLCTLHAAFMGSKWGKTVWAGTLVHFKLKVINTGFASIPALNVQLGLPDNVCFIKGAVKRARATKKRARIEPNRPIVVDQKAQWINMPVEPLDSRLFKVKARVSPLHPTGSVAVSVLLYALNATGGIACASSVPPIQLSIKALPASRAAIIAAKKKNITCVSPPTPRPTPVPTPAPIVPPFDVYVEDCTCLEDLPGRRRREHRRQRERGLVASEEAEEAPPRRLLLRELTDTSNASRIYNVTVDQCAVYWYD